MSTHQYHKVLPTSNNTNGFTAHDSIDFLINASPDRALVPNSIMLEYSLEVFKTGTTVLTAAVKDEICLSSASALFDSFRVETESQGIIENLLNYNRYCYMVNKMTKSKNDLFNSADAIEGNYPFRSNEFINCQQKCTQSGGASISVDSHFVIKPKIAFNRSVGGNYMFKDGYIRLSTTLARVEKALYGRYSATTDMSYSIKNVAVRYETVDVSTASKQPLMAFSYKSIKASVDSQNNMIQAIVPSKSCSGVMMSFISQTDENSFRENSNELQVIHGINGLRFLYNSNLGERVAYNITDVREMIQQGADVLNSSGDGGQLTRQSMATNNSFVLGIDFKNMIDLSNVDTQINIQCDASFSGAVHNAYLYFLEVLEL